MATLRIKYLATSVQMQMHLLVFLPEPLPGAGVDGASDARLKVLWLLHGEGGDCTDWTRLSMVEHHAQAAHIALVMPNLDNSMGMDMAHGGYPYFTYLAHDLPAHVRDLVRVLSDRTEDNFVAGVGAGGHAAVKWALREPGMFAAAACLSGELDMAAALREKEKLGTLSDAWAAAFGSASRLEGSEDDILQLARQRLEGSLPGATVHLATSGQDESLGRNREAVAQLRLAGLHVVEQAQDGKGGWSLWNEALRGFIERIVMPERGSGRPDVAD
jgi:S-formylglutathione hydrolase FrmB